MTSGICMSVVFNMDKNKSKNDPINKIDPYIFPKLDPMHKGRPPVYRCSLSKRFELKMFTPLHYRMSAHNRKRDTRIGREQYSTIQGKDGGFHRSCQQTYRKAVPQTGRMSGDISQNYGVLQIHAEIWRHRGVQAGAIFRTLGALFA